MRGTEGREKMTKGVRRYRRLKAAGICVACGRNPASDGYVRCKECRERYEHKRLNQSRWQTDFVESKKIIVYMMALLTRYAETHGNRKVHIDFYAMRECYRAIQNSGNMMQERMIADERGTG